MLGKISELRLFVLIRYVSGVVLMLIVSVVCMLLMMIGKVLGNFM